MPLWPSKPSLQRMLKHWQLHASMSVEHNGTMLAADDTSLEKMVDVLIQVPKKLLVCKAHDEIAA